MASRIILVPWQRSNKGWKRNAGLCGEETWSKKSKLEVISGYALDLRSKNPKTWKKIPALSVEAILSEDWKKKLKLELA
ncbi:hypothetical protein R1flu_006770 [Riccia fluitans]|uniref:Uncharacterized protein n=1 Tax=Riccia fluitans TaxID=41844 RepID=A0ABD1YWZ3_9MARC